MRAMKISVRCLLPMFALMLALFAQVSTALQHDEHAILVVEVSDVSVPVLELDDDPDSPLTLARIQTGCYATNNSFSAAAHEFTIQLVTCADARAPPLL